MKVKKISRYFIDRFHRWYRAQVLVQAVPPPAQDTRSPLLYISCNMVFMLTCLHHTPRPALVWSNPLLSPLPTLVIGPSLVVPPPPPPPPLYCSRYDASKCEEGKSYLAWSTLREVSSSSSMRRSILAAAPAPAPITSFVAKSQTQNIRFQDFLEHRPEPKFLSF